MPKGPTGQKRPADANKLAFFAGKIAEHFILIVRASLPRFGQELHNGVFALSSKARNATNRIAFAKQVQDLGAFLRGQSVHTDYYA